MREYWAKAKPEPTSANTNSVAHIGCQRAQIPSSFAACKIHLSWIVSIPCAALLGRRPMALAPDILGFPLKPRLRLHSFTQWPLGAFLQRERETTLPYALDSSLKASEIIHSLFILASFMPLKPSTCELDDVVKLYCQHGMDSQPLESH